MFWVEGFYFEEVGGAQQTLEVETVEFELNDTHIHWSLELDVELDSLHCREGRALLILETFPLEDLRKSQLSYFFLLLRLLDEEFDAFSIFYSVARLGEVLEVEFVEADKVFLGVVRDAQVGESVLAWRSDPDVRTIQLGQILELLFD